MAAEVTEISKRSLEMVGDYPESGVDMAFDALMDLEENSDLSNFMKTFVEDAGDSLELWSSLGCGAVSTNKATLEVLRYVADYYCELEFYGHITFAEMNLCTSRKTVSLP